MRHRIKARRGTGDRLRRWQIEDGWYLDPGELSASALRSHVATRQDQNGISMDWHYVQLTPLSFWPGGKWVKYVHAVIFLGWSEDVSFCIEESPETAKRLQTELSPRVQTARTACQEALHALGFNDGESAWVQRSPLQPTLFSGPYRYDFETWGYFGTRPGALFGHVSVTYRPFADDRSVEILFTSGNMAPPARKIGTVDSSLVIFVRDEDRENFFLAPATPRAFLGYPGDGEHFIIARQDLPFPDGMAQIVHFTVGYRRPAQPAYRPSWPSERAFGYGCFDGTVFAPHASELPPAPNWIDELLELEDGRVFDRVISRFDGSVDAGAASYPNMKLQWDFPQLMTGQEASYWEMIEQANSFLERPGQRGYLEGDRFLNFLNWGGDDLGTGNVNMLKGGSAPGRKALEAAKSNLRYRAGHSGHFSRCSVASQHTAPGHLFDAWIRTGKDIYRRGIVDMAECLVHEPELPHSGRSEGSLLSIFHMASNADQEIEWTLGGAVATEKGAWSNFLMSRIETLRQTAGSYPAVCDLKSLPAPATKDVLSLHQRGDLEVIFEDWMTAWALQSLIRIAREEILIRRDREVPHYVSSLGSVYRLVTATLDFICGPLSDQELGHPYKAHLEPPAPHLPWVPCENEDLITPGKYHWSSSATWNLQALGPILFYFRDWISPEQVDLYERHLARLIDGQKTANPATAAARRYYEEVYLWKVKNGLA